MGIRTQVRRFINYFLIYIYRLIWINLNQRVQSAPAAFAIV